MIPVPARLLAVRCPAGWQILYLMEPVSQQPPHGAVGIRRQLGQSKNVLDRCGRRDDGRQLSDHRQGVSGKQARVHVAGYVRAEP